MQRVELSRCAHHRVTMIMSCVLLIGLFTMGCTSHPRKQIPQGWYIAPEQVSPLMLTNHVTEHEVTSSPDKLTVATLPTPKLQVFICYGWMTSNHACMRIQGPEQHALFWDPGGGYGQHDDDIPTKYDLLLDEHAISVEEVWHYRSVGCNEPAMLMFEWPLSQQDARNLRDVLVQGQRQDGQGGRFESDAPGGFCSMALSSFLRKFSSHTPLPRRWFWPHNLAKQLWKYDPARVVLYQRHQQPVVYVASDPKPRRNAIHHVTQDAPHDVTQTAKRNDE